MAALKKSARLAYLKPSLNSRIFMRFFGPGASGLPAFLLCFQGDKK